MGGWVEPVPFPASDRQRDYGTRERWPTRYAMVPWTGSRMEETSPLLTVRMRAKQRIEVLGNASWSLTTRPSKVEPRVITSSTKVMALGFEMRLGAFTLTEL